MCITPAALCSYATKTSLGKKVWATSGNYRQHATEAKRRGLSCGVSSVTASTSKTCSQDPKFCDGTELCQRATRLQSGKKVWVNNQHTVHAKRVGLSCGVSTVTATVPKQNKCEDDPKLCTVIQLCQKASTTKNGKNTTYIG